MRGDSSPKSETSLEPIALQHNDIKTDQSARENKTSNEPTKVPNLLNNFLETNDKSEPFASFKDVPLKMIKTIDKTKNANDIMLLVKTLKNHPVFNSLTETNFEKIIRNAYYGEIKNGENIFKEGEPCQDIYIIDRGTVELTYKNKSIRDLVSGCLFGDDLIYGSKCFYTARAVETCFLWVFDQGMIKLILEEIISRDYLDNLLLLESIDFFKKMEDEQKEFMASILIPHKYSQNQIIKWQDEPTIAFFIIQKGAIKIIQDGVEIKTLQKGEFFGEKEIYHDTIGKFSVKAHTNILCYAIGRNAFTRFFEGKLEGFIHWSLQKSAIENCILLMNFSKAICKKILDGMKISPRMKGDIIFQKDHPFDKIMVLISGTMVKVIPRKLFTYKESSKLVVCQEGQVIGEACVIDSTKNKRLNDNIIMESDGLVAEISKDDVEGMIFEEREESKQPEIFTQNSKKFKDGNEASKEIKSLKDLTYFKKLRTGQFFTSHLVKYKNDLYTLKAIPKKLIEEACIERYIQDEKDVVNKISHPFIMNYYRSFEDNKYYYLLGEYIHGIELWDAIRDIGLLGTMDAQFYTASLILFLEYMHAMGIVHRDIKPENIIVDESGYIKVAEFGNSKIIGTKSKKFTRTFTIIGTPHYMAPEIITGKGYVQYVDLWSLGVVLYEFMCGFVPFGDTLEDPYDIYEQIIMRPVQFPAFLQDKKARRLIDQLLHKIPEERLGGSYSKLKANPWFEDFDFNQLYHKTMAAPYFPPKNKLVSEDEMMKMNESNQKFNQSLIS